MIRRTLLFCLLAIGCKDPPTPDPTGATSALASASAASSAPSASAAPKRKQPPRTKAYGNPRTQQVGTLPDGVGLAVGTRVPDVTVENADGEPVALSSLYRTGGILLVFYRGGWCPFCNFQIREIARAKAQFARRKLTPVLVSVDRPSEAARTQSVYSADFPVLSDPDLKLHRAFNVTTELDAEKVRELRERDMDVEAHSGKKHHTIAIPSVFWVDAAGIVRFAHGERDHKIRPSAIQILSAIDRIRREAAGAAPSASAGRPDDDVPVP